MDWEQKFQALQALLIFKGDASLHMRKPKDWYMRLPGVNIKRKHTETSVGESGRDPEEAVTKTWITLTSSLPLDARLSIDAGNGKRFVRWNGFMWEDVVED